MIEVARACDGKISPSPLPFSHRESQTPRESVTAGERRGRRTALLENFSHATLVVRMLWEFERKRYVRAQACMGDAMKWSLLSTNFFNSGQWD